MGEFEGGDEAGLLVQVADIIDHIQLFYGLLITKLLLNF